MTRNQRIKILVWELNWEQKINDVISQKNSHKIQIFVNELKDDFGIY